MSNSNLNTLASMLQLATNMTDQEELTHLNTAIEIAIGNEQDKEEAAEEAKMARDAQEYADSLPK